MTANHLDNQNLNNEKELLQKIAEGDEQAFAQLMRDHHIGVYYAVHRLTGDRWMAEEAVQDTFLKIWLKRASLPQIDNFPGWLNTIAENVALNAIKQAQRKKNDVKSWVADFYKDINKTTIEENYLTGLLQQAVERLSPRQKEAYSLVREQGFQREEAARLMQVSLETVKTHLEQAMRNIRAYCFSRLDHSALFILFFLGAENFF